MLVSVCKLSTKGHAAVADDVVINLAIVVNVSKEGVGVACMLM